MEMPTHIKSRAGILGASLSVLAAMVPTQSQAQQENFSFLEEITVTAEKRESTLQDTPISIAALNPEALEATQTFSPLDIQYSVPGLTVGVQGSNAFVFLRGVGTNIVATGVDPSVALYTDGIYRVRQRDALVDFLDIERVEVLKGPQGTLYGRNATGGAINVINKAPSLDDLSGSVEVRYGNYDHIQVAGVINAPVSDRVAIRLAGQYHDRDGYTENLNPNGRQRIDDNEFYQLRGRVLFEATDTFNVIASFEYYEREFFGPSYQPVVSNCTPAFTPINSFIAPCNQIIAGGLAPEEDQDARIANNSNTDASNFSYFLAGLEFDWEINDAWNLNSKTAFINSNADTSTDIDGTSADIALVEVGLTGVNGFEEEDSESFSHETVFNYDDGGRLIVTGGFTYFQEKVLQPVLIDTGAVVAAPPPPIAPPGTPPSLFDFGFTSISDLEARAAGVFTQATYSLRDNLRLTGGVRYSWERKEFRTDITAFGAVPAGPPNFFAPNFPFADSMGPIDFAADSESWNAVTGVARLEFDVNEDILLYASINRGFKGGAFNTTPIARNEGPIDPEIIWSYELGMKSTLLDNRVRFNSSVFYYDYSDIQVSLYPPENVGLATVENAASATVFGVEANLVVAVTEGLVVDFMMEYVDSEYGEFLTVDPFTINPVMNPLGTVVNLEGNPLVSAPKWSLGSNIVHSADFGGMGVLTSSVSWAYKSEHFFSPFAREFERQGGYSIFSAQVEWESEDGAISVAGYVDNLTNEDVRLNVVSQAPNGIAAAFFNDPRTYGLRARFSF